MLLLFYSHYMFLPHKIKTSVLLFASFKYQSTTVSCVRCVCPRRQRFLSVWFLFVRSLFFFFKWLFKSLNCLPILSKKNNLKFCYINYNPGDSNSRVMTVHYRGQKLAVNTELGERDITELWLWEHFILSFEWKLQFI